MLGAIVTVAGAMFYEEQRDFENALLALRDEQLAIATAVAADFESRLEREGEPTELPDDARLLAALVFKLLGGARKLEQSHSRLILVDIPDGRSAFVTASGVSLDCEALRAAIDGGLSHAVLSRADAAAIGLPERIAVAGIRNVGAAKRWHVSVVASAERLRARERRSQLRLALGVIVAASLVGAFGGLALKNQRRELATARQLEIAAMQRERERLLARTDKMTTLATLSGGIAHQVATPLGTILARVEQVRASLDHDPRSAAALDIVSDQVGRIQRVIRSVLALARGNDPTTMPTAPAQVLRGALDATDHRLQQAGIAATTQISGDLPAILCDPHMLEQALVNLLLNACEASVRGATIDIRIEQHASTVSFIVDDEGEGITEEAVTRAGELFYTTKSTRGGTGLGLAIATEIAAHHHGKLRLERRTPIGTRAVLEVPIANGPTNTA
jgi:signal transduction histidine kinase